MASKLQEYRRMSEEAQRQLTGSLERWQSFLATASRLYKYPYHEQVMIHAQRPDATACAEFDVWNNTMRRYVRRGSKGIALIDTSGDRERLSYVFDVSDTGTRPNSRSLNLWELREEHIPAVSSMLEKNYGVPAGESLAVQLEAVASQLAREYWEDNRRDILGILEDSFLEEYDEFNVGVAFRNAAEVSISYSLMLRCGLEPENYFEHEDFMLSFQKQVTEVLNSKQLVVAQMKVKSTLKDLLKKFKYYRLSLYTFSLASLLEIMLSGNFKEEYITGIKGEIESLSMTYRDLYGKCSEYLERLGNSALEANLLKGIGSASNAVGRLIGSIPKIKDGQVDEFLQDSGERLKNNAVGMERSVVKAFAEISNPGTGVFTEKMRDMILIFNHTAEICFDDKQIYLIAE